MACIIVTHSADRPTHDEVTAENKKKWRLSFKVMELAFMDTSVGVINTYFHMLITGTQTLSITIKQCRATSFCNYSDDKFFNQLFRTFRIIRLLRDFWLPPRSS